MINLIPNQEKKKIARDFYIRLLAVSFAMLGAAVFIGCVAMLPAYFISIEYKNLADNKIAIQKNTPNPITGEGTVAKVRDVDSKLRFIESLQNRNFLVSQDIVNEVLKYKTSAIKINSMLYSDSNQEGKKIIVSGVASSREGLMSFHTAVKGSKAFKEVSLPISNFVKGSDITFTLTLITAI